MHMQNSENLVLVNIGVRSWISMYFQTRWNIGAQPGWLSLEMCKYAICRSQVTLSLTIALERPGASADQGQYARADRAGKRLKPRFHCQTCLPRIICGMRENGVVAGTGWHCTQNGMGRSAQRSSCSLSPAMQLGWGRQSEHEY